MIAGNITGYKKRAVLFCGIGALFLLAVGAANFFFVAESAPPVQLTAQERGWLKAHPVIRLAPDPDFPPVEFFDKNSAYRGITGDYVALMEKKLGIRLQIVHLKDWDEVIAKAKRREIDVYVASQTPQRGEYMLFTKPFLEFPLVIIAKEKMKSPLSLDKLSGMKISVVSQYAGHDLLSRDYPTLHLDPVPDVKTGLRKVVLGFTDVFVESLATSTYYIEKEGISNLQIAGETEYAYRLGFCSRKDWPELNRILDKGLAALSADEKKGIHKKWIPFEPTSFFLSKEFQRDIVTAVAAILLTIAGFIAWNRVLARQVRLRTVELEKELAERRRVEEALRFTQYAVDNTIDEAYWMTEDGRLFYVNDAACRSLGYSREELLGMTIPDIDPDFPPEAFAQHWRNIKECGFVRLETVHRAKDGRIFPVEVRANHVVFDGKEYNCAFATNISERKRAEAELNEARADLEKKVEARTAELRHANELLEREIAVRKRTEKVNLARLRLLQVAGSRTLEELLEATLDEAEALTGSLIAFFVETDEKTVYLHNWSTRTKAEFCKAEGKGRHYDISAAGVWVDCIHQRRPVIHNDYYALPHRKGMPPEHAPLIRELVVPVFRGDKIVAVLAVGNKACDYTQEDVEAVSLLADLAWEITERKRIEEELLLSQFCIDNACVGIYCTDENSAIFRVNDYACEALGYSKEELCSRTVFDIDPEVTWEKILDVRKELALVGQVTHETTHRRKDGTTFPAEVTGTSLEFRGKKFVISFVKDITEKKRALEELELNQFIVQEASIGIHRVAADGRIIFANETFCQNLGYTAEELYSLTLFNINPLFDAETFQEHRRLTQAAGARTIETVHRRKDGSTFPVEVTVNYLKYQDKQVNVSFAKDITERKKAEEVLLISRFCIDKAGIGIFQCDETGTIFSVNEHACKSLGYTSEELCALTVFDIDPAITPEKIAAMKETLDKSGSITIETLHKRRDGSVFPVEITTSVVDFRGKEYTFSFVKDIAQRKEAEESLKRATEEWERTFASVPDLIAIVDNEHRIQRVNESLAQRLGVKPEECMGLHCYELIHGTSEPPSFCPHLQTLQDGGKHVVEMHEDNLGGDFLVSSIPLKDERGEMVGAVHISYDITERKRAEEALRESEARLKMSMDLARLVQWEYDVSSGMFTFDDQFYALYGTTAEREGGRLMSAKEYARRFIPADEHAVVQGGVAEVLVRSCNQLEHRIVRPDGEERYILVRGEGVRDEAGRIVKIRGANQDITERKRIEEALRESRQKYQVIVDSFDGLIYVCSEDLRLTFMNRKLIERTGYDATGELCYQVMHDRDSVCPWCVNHRVFAGETIHWDMFSPKDQRWYEVLNVPIRHANGSMSKHAMMIDITDRKLSEDQLKRQKKLLQELNETLERRVGEEVAKNREKDIMLIQQNRQAALGEMLDHIAHQWKQPLNSISLLVALMGARSQDEELTDDEVQGTITKINSLLQHMAQTIDVFRRFYSPDKEKKLFRIKESIDQALTFITPAYRFHTIAVEVDAADGLTGYGYPKEFTQVLLNILANARDVFRNRNTQKPRVAVRAFADDEKAVVTIVDNAGGIAESIIERIFDFYFTTHEASGGTGIGLYMSKNIIEKNMGGTLCAENAKGGACFRIEIPTGAAAPPAPSP